MDTLCRGNAHCAEECGRCEAIRGDRTTTTLKYRPLRRFILHLISSEEGRAAVIEWAKQAGNPSGGMNIHPLMLCSAQAQVHLTSGC